MKTFETEKHNIPEGATHYREETNRDSFAWVCFYPTPKLTIDGVSISGVDLAVSGESLNNLKPIPQTNIETPEEKEALDLINTTLQQYEMSKLSGKSEWVNGDEVVISSKSKSQWFVVGVSPVTKTSTVCISNTGELKSFHTSSLKKPETPQQREERERLEDGQSLYELVQSLWCTVDSKYTPHPFSSPMVDDKTKEMYARLARAVDYRKEGD